MLLSQHQNTGQNGNIKRVNRSSKNGSQLKYLGMTVTNQNLIQEETMRRFNLTTKYCIAKCGYQVQGVH
jgi:hypothetical protein